MTCITLTASFTVIDNGSTESRDRPAIRAPRSARPGLSVEGAPACDPRRRSRPLDRRAHHAWVAVTGRAATVVRSRAFAAAPEEPRYHDYPRHREPDPRRMDQTFRPAALRADRHRAFGGGLRRAIGARSRRSPPLRLANTIEALERSGRTSRSVTLTVFNLAGTDTDATIQRIEHEIAPSLCPDLHFAQGRHGFDLSAGQALKLERYRTRFVCSSAAATRCSRKLLFEGNTTTAACAGPRPPQQHVVSHHLRHVSLAILRQVAVPQASPLRCPLSFLIQLIPNNIGVRGTSTSPVFFPRTGPARRSPGFRRR